MSPREFRSADDLEQQLRRIAADHYANGDHDAARVILDALDNAKQGLRRAGHG